MTVTFDSFVGGFPEFKGTPKTLVEAKIAEAKLMVDAEVFRGKTDLGVSYMTAHLLSFSAHGQHARLQPKNAKVTREDALTTYERMFRRIQRTVTSGFRVTGDC